MFVRKKGKKLKSGFKFGYQKQLYTFKIKNFLLFLRKNKK